VDGRTHQHSYYTLFAVETAASHYLTADTVLCHPSFFDNHSADSPLLQLTPELLCSPLFAIVLLLTLMCLDNAFVCPPVYYHETDSNNDRHRIETQDDKKATLISRRIRCPEHLLPPRPPKLKPITTSARPILRLAGVRAFALTHASFNPCASALPLPRNVNTQNRVHLFACRGRPYRADAKAMNQVSANNGPWSAQMLFV